MIYLNNRLVPAGKAVVSVFDHGFLYGDGVYETLRAYDGVAFKIEEHIERLFNSAALIRLDISKTPEAIIRAVNKTVKANRLSDAYIRITISRGKGPIGLDPALCPKSTFVIIANPFQGYPSAYYRSGVNIAIVSSRRNFNKSIDPAIKSLNFLNNILAKIEGKERGAYEAVMLNYRGYIAEGTISNIFFVKNGTLYTPAVSTGILNGITRMAIIGIAEELGIKVREGKFRPADIYKAEEVFISNTTMELMPVSTVDDIKMSSSAGKVTKAIHHEYKRKVAEYIRQNA